MRRLAWCATTRSTSSARRPLASIASWQADAMLRTACANTALPFIFTTWRFSATVAAAVGDDELLPLRPVGQHVRREDAARPHLPVFGAEDDRAGAVAEEDAGVA